MTTGCAVWLVMLTAAVLILAVRVEWLEWQRPAPTDQPPSEDKEGR